MIKKYSKIERLLTYIIAGELGFIRAVIAGKFMILIITLK